ncbi:helicase [Prolixibacteraceae bacterium JC049]|nr:helicase [Prolixibacteraceae bacterium JC049]
MTIANPDLELAYQFVSNTNASVFLSGKAGTGKTTFLHRIKDEVPKRMIIVAPTGVAAINAGGVTIHSFFQLPFTPHVPGSDGQSNESEFKFSKIKKDIIRTLDLLIIDEISMVRADLLDAIDSVLRKYRYSNKPFGGVQLLMIGDLQQLAPVAKPTDWQILKNYYQTVFFFSSKAFQNTKHVNIELKTIYRQTDKKFISILNEIRENALSKSAHATLMKRYNPQFDPEKEEGYIILTTHNYRAQSINEKRLNQLETKPHQFKATIDGDFPEYAYPTYAQLELKVGAQVMFVKNDTTFEKSYYNGKIGVIERFQFDKIVVRCEDREDPIYVEKEQWENVKYKLNKETNSIEEEVVGSFVQYPLKPAWAITIHKSQGLTFEKAVIDAQSAFAHGQVYVALSRCRTLEGMVLHTPISESAIINDPSVVSFSRHMEANHPNEDLLKNYQCSYQYDLLHALFNFEEIARWCSKLNYLLERNRERIQGTLLDLPEDNHSKCIESVFDVADRFRNQLRVLEHKNLVPEKDTTVQERISKAANYFLTEMEKLVVPYVDNTTAETDNVALQLAIDAAMDQLHQEIHIKMKTLPTALHEFSCNQFLQKQTQAVLHPPRRIIKATPISEKNLNHPELYQALKIWRREKANKEHCSVSQIISQTIMLKIANTLPTKRSELNSIKGVGKKTMQRHGSEIMELITEYYNEFQPEGIEPPEESLFF